MTETHHPRCPVRQDVDAPDPRQCPWCQQIEMLDDM